MFEADSAFDFDGAGSDDEDSVVLPARRHEARLGLELLELGVDDEKVLRFLVSAKPLDLTYDLLRLDQWQSRRNLLNRFTDSSDIRL